MHKVLLADKIACNFRLLAEMVPASTPVYVKLVILVFIIIDSFFCKLFGVSLVHCRIFFFFRCLFSRQNFNQFVVVCEILFYSYLYHVFAL